MKKILVLSNILFMAAVLCLAAAPASAAEFAASGNPDDTDYGDTITCPSPESTFNYKDLAGNPRPTVHGNTIEVTCAPEFGFSYAVVDWPTYTYFDGATGTYYLFAEPSGTGTMMLIITNEGNSDVTVVATASAYSYTGGASGWGVEIWDGGVDQGTEYSKLMYEDEDYTTLEVRIVIPTTEAETPDLSTGFFTLVVTCEEAALNTATTESHRYTGANLLEYGGQVTVMAGMNMTIEAPAISITRTVTVDSPAAYYGFSAGGDHDWVPGSLVTITLVYTNEGSAAANYVAICDKVPNNCLPLVVNVLGPIANVELTAPPMTGEATWDVFYSTEEAPPVDDYMMGYTPSWGENVNGWYYGVSSGNQVSPPYDTGLLFDDNQRTYGKWVRFETGALDIGQTGTISWSLLLK